MPWFRETVCRLLHQIEKLIFNRKRPRTPCSEKGGRGGCVCLPLGGGRVSARFYLILGELEEGGSGVCSRGEDEDKRRDAGGVGVGPDQVEGRRLDELSPDLLHDELLDRRNNLQEQSGRLIRTLNRASHVPN